MSIVLLAVVGGCVFFMVRILMDFRAYEMNAEPKIEELEKKLNRLSEQMALETTLLEDVRERVGELRVAREALTSNVEAQKGVVLMEKAKFQTLTLEVQKRVFRGTLARGRKMALK